MAGSSLKRRDRARFARCTAWPRVPTKSGQRRSTTPPSPAGMSWASPSTRFTPPGCCSATRRRFSSSRRANSNGFATRPPACLTTRGSVVPRTKASARCAAPDAGPLYSTLSPWRQATGPRRLSEAPARRLCRRVSVASALCRGSACTPRRFAARPRPPNAVGSTSRPARRRRLRCPRPHAASALAPRPSSTPSRPRCSRTRYGGDSPSSVAASASRGWLRIST